MPIYEYACTNCDHRLEILQQLSDAPLEDCPECGESSLKKLVSAASFQLKGTGWYATDYRDQNKAKGKDEEKKDDKPKVKESQSADNKDSNVSKTKSAASAGGTS